VSAAATLTPATSPVESLGIMMRSLKLPAFARYAEEIAQKAEREGWTFGRYLHHLAELEIQERRRRRIERLLHASDLPREKTLATLKRSRLPAKVAKTLPTLCEGVFVERGDNVLAFGLPGRGKTHLVCALGHVRISAIAITRFGAWRSPVSRHGDHLFRRIAIGAKRRLSWGPVGVDASRSERSDVSLSRFLSLILTSGVQAGPGRLGADGVEFNPWRVSLPSAYVGTAPQARPCERHGGRDRKWRPRWWGRRGSHATGRV
jgi:hypothetical protein